MNGIKIKSSNIEIDEFQTSFPIIIIVIRMPHCIIDIFGRASSTRTATSIPRAYANSLRSSEHDEISTSILLYFEMASCVQRLRLVSLFDGVLSTSRSS